MSIQIYLELNRPDIAIKMLTSLKTWADDSTLAQLIESFVNLYTVI